MSKPVRKNLDLYRGDDFDYFFRVRSQSWDSVNSVWVPGDYIDLTGWTAAAQVRAEASLTSELLATFSCLILDQVAVPGGVIISLTREQTKDLNDSFWDCQLTSPTNKRKTYLAGKVKMGGEVTA